MLKKGTPLMQCVVRAGDVHALLVELYFSRNDFQTVSNCR